MQELRKKGFSQAYALKGGFVEWTKAGFPTQNKDFVQDTCVACHEQATPEIVRQWKQSAHSSTHNEVSCSVCHGDEHTSAQDVSQAKPVPEKICRTCHEHEYVQFRQGKHAKAWDSMLAWPDFHHQGQKANSQKDCTHCHGVGLKPRADIGKLRNQDHPTGAASCNNCHTGHAYSLHQARSPQACQPCHNGPESPQMQAYKGSAHGRLFEASSPQKPLDPGKPPTCQTCHFAEKSHGVQNAWGSLGLRLPWPEDLKWCQARRSIMKALGLYAPEAGDQIYQHIADLQLMTLSEKRWSFRRSQMLGTCMQCHEGSWAEEKLDRAEDILRRADLLMGQALNLASKKGEGKSMPDISSFDPDFSETEKIVYRMFHIQRKKAISGAFHSNWSMAEKGLRSMRTALQDMQRIQDGR
ncbi:MAG: multiheme c-type cytochrome [Desulfovermiculus sp.]